MISVLCQYINKKKNISARTTQQSILLKEQSLKYLSIWTKMKLKKTLTNFKIIEGAWISDANRILLFQVNSNFTLFNK